MLPINPLLERIRASAAAATGGAAPAPAAAPASPAPAPATNLPPALSQLAAGFTTPAPSPAPAPASPAPAGFAAFANAPAPGPVGPVSPAPAPVGPAAPAPVGNGRPAPANPFDAAHGGVSIAPAGPAPVGPIGTGGDYVSPEGFPLYIDCIPEGVQSGVQYASAVVGKALESLHAAGRFDYRSDDYGKGRGLLSDTVQSFLAGAYGYRPGVPMILRTDNDPEATCVYAFRSFASSVVRGMK